MEVLLWVFVGFVVIFVLIFIFCGAPPGGIGPPGHPIPKPPPPLFRKHQK